MANPWEYLRWICLMLGGAIALPLQAQLPVFYEVSASSGIDPVEAWTPLYGNGVAAADFDMDGDIDFYLCTEKGQSDRLYQNDGTGIFTDIARSVGIAETVSNRAAIWMDYNGDHLLDLVVVGEKCANVSCQTPILISCYQQLPDHSFLEVSEDLHLQMGDAFDELPFSAVGGLAAGDLNQDDWLDLVVTVWGGGIKVFYNQQGNQFEEVSDSLGLWLEEPTPWQPMLYDFNRDGWLDIYCNVDFDYNKLWINQGGSFRDQAAVYGLSNDFNEMGMAMADYDNDGDLDIYLTNITRQFQNTYQHNLLFQQETRNGRIAFREVAQGVGVEKSGWDWGCTFLDINNDGRQDLATTNGMNLPDWGPDQSNLWLNTTAGFVNISAQCGFDDQLDATSLIAFDKDRDGDIDLLQSLKINPGTQQPVFLLENSLEQMEVGHHYLCIQPRMPGANHFAIGSLVSIRTEEFQSSKLISAGSGFYSQEPAEACFGLGKQVSVEEIQVRWPEGQVSIYQEIAIDQVQTLVFDWLEAPTELKAEQDQNLLHLKWEDNSTSETGFVLRISSDSLFRNVEIREVEANQTQFTDTLQQPTHATWYQVRARKGNLLSDNSNTLAIQSEEPASPRTDSQVLVYPNPMTDGILTVRNPTSGPINIRLVDLAGREVLEAEQKNPEEEPELDFHLEVNPGLYLLFVQIGKGETQLLLKVE